MTHEQFDYPNASMTSYSDAETDVQAWAEELYSRVGARFPVKWPGDNPRQPIVDSNDLPSGVSMSDVETALSNMKSDGVF